MRKMISETLITVHEGSRKPSVCGEMPENELKRRKFREEGFTIAKDLLCL